MRKLGMSVVAAVLLLAGAHSAFAGGPNVYPDGAEGFWMGAAPPPGFYYVNYDLWYTSDKYIENSGREAKVGPMADFKLTVLANVSRFLYVSKTQVFGGNWAAHMLVPIMDLKMHTGAGTVHAKGLGDIIVDPFILTWHSPNLHVVTGLDIYLPTSNYSEGRIANLGSNAFVWEPVLSFTWVTPVKGLAASTQFRYDFPEGNNDFTHPFLPASGELHYGQEFHMDYSVDYGVTDQWRVGLGGYFHKHITSDELDGVELEGGKDQVFAIGPGVEYHNGPWFVQLRPQIEMWAKNKPEGISTWLRVTYSWPAK